MADRYATTTTVQSGKSRGEVDALLRRWGCHQIMWADDFRAGRVLLRFVWEHEGTEYIARFPLKIPTDDELRKRARHATSGAFLQSKYDDLSKRRESYWDTIEKMIVSGRIPPEREPDLKLTFSYRGMTITLDPGIGLEAWERPPAQVAAEPSDG